MSGYAAAMRRMDREERQKSGARPHWASFVIARVHQEELTAEGNTSECPCPSCVDVRVYAATKRTAGAAR